MSVFEESPWEKFKKWLRSPNFAVAIITTILLLGGSAPIAMMISSDLTARSAEDMFQIISADIAQTAKNGEVEGDSQITGEAVGSATEGQIIDSVTSKTYVFRLPPVQPESSSIGKPGWTYIKVTGTVDDYTIIYGVKGANKTFVYNSRTGDISSHDYESSY